MPAAVGRPALPGRIFGDDEARKAVLEVRSKLDGFQQETLRQLKSWPPAGGDRAALGRLEQGQRVSLDQLNQLEPLRQEVARLRGQLEVQSNELSQTRKQQKDSPATLDTRLKQFEPVQVTIDDKHLHRRADRKAGLRCRARTVSRQRLQGRDRGRSRRSRRSTRTARSCRWCSTGKAAHSMPAASSRARSRRLSSWRASYPDSPRVPDALLILGNAQADSGDRKRRARPSRPIGDKFPGTPASGAAKERMAALR